MTGFDRRPSHVSDDDEEISLDTHLSDVADRVEMLVPEGATTPAGNSLHDLTRRVALVHDAGKLTSWFREHLLADDPNPDGPTHHAPFGAVLAHYVLSESGFDGRDPLLGFLAVAKHHGRLPDAADYVADATAAMTESRLRGYFRADVHDQAEDIGGQVPDLAAALVERATDGSGSWDDFRATLAEAERTKEYRQIATHACSGRRLSPAPGRLPDGFYAAALQVWSALVFADKTSAATLHHDVELGPAAYGATIPDRSAIDDRVAELRRENEAADSSDETDRLNERRESARESIRTRAKSFAASDRDVATLTLPTGMGKTLSGLDAALTTLTADADGKAPDGRVVYALPFTSIIDQVAAESRRVFDTSPSDLLTVDHHLAETEVSPPGPAEAIPDDARQDIAALLGEGWRSGLVVTTFVGLFESLVGPRNSRGMKLPALYDSVVVLDEPQALPLRWWPLVDRTTELLVDQYDASVIAMTATQPKLLSDGDRDPFALVKEADPYFEALDRLAFDLHPSVEAELDGEREPLAHDRAAELLGTRLADDSSVLAICNTIDSARELAEEVSTRLSPTDVNQVYDDRLSEADEETVTAELDVETTVTKSLRGRSGDEPLLVHLTTRHRPCDRRHLIDAATTLADAGEPVVFVSTQLVEAGVDVSFDEVARDFAPMDSLVQAAGRCNRSFDRDRGRVTVWHLEPPDEQTTTPAVAVYGSEESLTSLTALSLAEVYEGEPMAEPTVTREAVERYFERLDDRGVGTDEYVNYVDDAMAKSLGEESLIRERPAVDVVVARTVAEWNQLRAVRQAYDGANWDELDERVDSLQEMQVSVPLDATDSLETLQACEPLFPDATRLALDARAGHDAGYFDATDGVVVPETSAEARLL
ncbi:MAG: CRISPR-associated endonuclease Cas3'' [Halolamina sp.]